MELDFRFLLGPVCVATGDACRDRFRGVMAVEVLCECALVGREGVMVFELIQVLWSDCKSLAE